MSSSALLVRCNGEERKCMNPSNAELTGSEYLLLFRGTHWDNGLSPEEAQRAIANLTRWFEKLGQEGVIIGGHPLGDKGRTIYPHKPGTITDGPFAETKEAIGGYVMIRAQSLDAAAEIARSFPQIQYGTSVEVRPVLEVCPIFERVSQQVSNNAA